MKPIHLPIGPAQASLAPRFFGHVPRPWQRRMGLILLAALAAALAGAAWQLWQLRQQAAQVTAAANALRAPPARFTRQPAAATAALTAQQVRAWNQVIGRLNTPWSGIFDALEQATPTGVALLSIDPRPAEGSIRIQAEATTLDALLKYTDQLKATAPFGDVLLVKHETHDQDPQRPVRLTAEVRLLPPPGGRP